MTLNKISPYNILFAFPLAIILALIIGPILRHGMFLDGLVYTNLAKMLANDIGSFWQPLIYPSDHIFYEHPILLPWVESMFFKVLGNGLHTEDIYNFSVFAFTIWVMFLVWKQLVPAKQRKLFFFPLLLWVLSQEVQLRYPNTMLECGTTLILLFSTYGYLKIQSKYPILSYVIIGLGIFFAVLSKGPFGLFLLVLPFLHQRIVLGKWSTLGLLIPFFSTSVCFFLLFLLQPAALSFFLQYIDQQVVASIAGERTENIANSRFNFIYWLFILNLPAIIIAIATTFVRTEVPIIRKKEAILFMLLGTAAILPLAISIKQAAYYQLTSLPFFILGISLFLAPKVNELTLYILDNKVYRSILLCAAAVSIVGSSVVAFSMVGTTDRRDIETIEMAAEISSVLKELSVNDYNLVLLGNKLSAGKRGYTLTAFLARYHNVYLNQTGKATSTLVIKHGNEPIPVRFP